MKAKLVNFMRSLEWGRGATERDLLGQPRPTPLRTTAHVDHSECAAKRTRRWLYATKTFAQSTLHKVRTAAASPDAREAQRASSRKLTLPAQRASRAFVGRRRCRLCSRPAFSPTRSQPYSSRAVASRSDATAVGLNALVPALKVFQPDAVPVGLNALALTPKVSLASPLRGRVAAATIAVAMGLSLAVTSPAFALSRHTFSSSITGSGTNALAEPAAVAVDESTGDLYVADPPAHRVEKFGPTGEFLLMFGAHVNKTAVEAGGTSEEQDLCTEADLEAGAECQPGVASSATGGFLDSHELFLAIDNSGTPPDGDLYVADQAAGRVAKYGPDGHLVSSWAESGYLISAFEGLEGLEQPEGIGVDARGNLHVFTRIAGGKPRYHEFASDGAPIEAFLAEFHIGGYTYLYGANPGGVGIAADPAGDVLVPATYAQEGVAFLIDSAGSLIGGPQYVVEGSEIPDLARRPASGEFDVSGAAFAGPDLYLTRDNSGHSGSIQLYPGLTSCEPKPFGPGNTYHSPTAEFGCPVFDEFGLGEIEAPHGFAGIAVDAATGAVYVADPGHHRVAVYSAVPFLPQPEEVKATGLTPHSERFEGNLDPAGAGPITGCRFDWGTTTAFSSGSVSCEPAASTLAPFSATEPTPVGAEATGLSPSTTYRVRLVGINANGEDGYYNVKFTTLPEKPAIDSESATAVRSEAALLHARLDPRGSDTQYRFEYGTTTAYGNSAPVPDADAGSNLANVSAFIAGLAPDTTYHYRVLAENEGGSVQGPDQTFTTLPFFPLENDSCPNAHVRQQTGSAHLLDCRAYELASASDTAGYDVESSIVPGQAPYGGYPQAEGRLLYAVHDGGIPSTANPTNRGPDPYLATRTENGWSTEYVGIPANYPGAAGSAPFASTLLQADAGLDTFAFGGPELCSPCFADGSSGIPVRLPGDSLVQGMTGPGAEPATRSEAVVAAPLSVDGTHLIFASTSLFAPGGNEETGNVSIYDRDLKTDQTHVVSDNSAGEPLPCLQGEGRCHSPTDPNGIAELGLSKDGSHVLIAQKVTEDAAHNAYYHLYMDIDDAPETIELTPGASKGVLFDGMSEDGTEVFFSSEEHLTGKDTVHSGADLYMWSQKGEAEGQALTLISRGEEGEPGTPGDTAACDPAANAFHEHWNSLGASPNCGVLAIGGGAGVVPDGSGVYFLSPERLAAPTEGTQNAPNLYFATAVEGWTPRYVTTLESALTAPHPPKLRRAFSHNFGSFSKATALAVDPASGDVYVLDTATNAVEKLTASGSPVASFGDTTPTPNGLLHGKATPANSFSETAGLPTSLAVGDDESIPTYGDLYVPDYGHEVIDRFDSGGTFLSQTHLEAPPTAVAVNPDSGNVYVAEAAASKVVVLTPTGTQFSSFETISAPTSIAVAADGTVYVGNAAEAASYGPTGSFLRKLDPSPVKSLAVEPATDDVFADEGTQIARYDSSGTLLETIGATHLSGSIGLAATPEGSLYATTAASARNSRSGGLDAAWRSSKGRARSARRRDTFSGPGGGG